MILPADYSARHPTLNEAERAARLMTHKRRHRRLTLIHHAFTEFWRRPVFDAVVYEKRLAV